MFKRQKIDVEVAKLALKAYQEIPVKFIDVLLEQALELSYSQKIYAYDAYLNSMCSADKYFTINPR